VTLSASSDTCVSISLQQNQGKTDGLHENRSDFKERQCQALDFNPTEDPRMKDLRRTVFCCAAKPRERRFALARRPQRIGDGCLAMFAVTLPCGATDLAGILWVKSIRHRLKK
jgi:hypothetical protein